MKVLQINCVYNSGSTGKIVCDISAGLKSKEIESVVCYGRGKKVNKQNVYKVSTELEAKIHSALWRLFGLQFGFSPIATAKTINIIKKEKPDAVHLHCLNGNFINVSVLGMFRIPDLEKQYIMYALEDDDPYNENGAVLLGEVIVSISKYSKKLSHRVLYL